MEVFYCWRDMVVYPDVADDLATHVLYVLKFIELILRGTSQKGIAVVDV